MTKERKIGMMKKKIREKQRFNPGNILHSGEKSVDEDDEQPTMNLRHSNRIRSGVNRPE